MSKDYPYQDLQAMREEFLLSRPDVVLFDSWERDGDYYHCDVDLSATLTLEIFKENDKHWIWRILSDSDDPKSGESSTLKGAKHGAQNAFIEIESKYRRSRPRTPVWDEDREE